MSVFDLHSQVLVDDEIYDAMLAAQRSGLPYQMALNPAPGG